MEKEKRYSKNNRLIAIAIVVIVILLSLVGLISRWIVSEQDTIECYSETVPTMSIQQVSDLLSISLVEAIWLPDDVQSVYSISSLSAGWSQHKYCSVTITYSYSENDGDDFLMSVSVCEKTGLNPTPFPLSCSYGFSDTGPTGSSCNLDFHAIDSTLDLRFTFSRNLSTDEILWIIDGMTVIDPTE